MSSSLVRSLTLLDAVQDTQDAVRPMAQDEALLAGVKRMLEEAGTPASDAQIRAVALQLDERTDVPAPSPLIIAPSPTPGTDRDYPWRVRLALAISRWLLIKAQRWLPAHVPLLPEVEGTLSAQERQELAAFRDLSQKDTPIISDTEANRWKGAVWEVIHRRMWNALHTRGRRHGGVTGDDKKQLGTIPNGQDPLISPHFSSNAFTDPDRGALADLFYTWLDHPERMEEQAVDEPLIRYLVSQGLNPDVPQGRVWLGLDHPRQTGWSIRQSCAYLHLSQGLDLLEEAPPSVPAKEKDSLLWWGLEAHFEIDYPSYWGFWARPKKSWVHRFQASTLWILNHEQAPHLHAKLLRKAIARNHPQAAWLEKQLTQRGWAVR